MPSPIRWISWTYLLLVGVLGFYLWSARIRPLSLTPEGVVTGTIPLAVIGDSDSHSYQDRISFPPGGDKRGGAHHEATLQWTEVLARLRGQRLDPGEWGAHGTRGTVARARRWLGLEGRSPPKEDYRYNFALSGSECSDLLEGYAQQAKALVSLMDQQPAYWRNGVVVIRIGVNTFGDAAELEQMAHDPMAIQAQRKIASCVHDIRQSVDALHARHPGVRIVLVGIFDNSNWVPYLDRWRNPIMLANIGRGLDMFDHALQGMAREDPRIAFFDDRAWFADHWGGRDARGSAAYHELVVGDLHVRNTAGDEPHNAVLADGHAGTAWNAEWARSLVELLNSRFHLGIAPITEAEVIAMVGTKWQGPWNGVAPSKKPAIQKLDSPVASVNR
ncbi:MAG: GDSL-type esterase/lipase family protein [Pseudoxanthomonas sp.]